MHGNVWEWVADCYKDYANAPADGKAASDALCPRRVIRGSSWIAHTRFLHSAYRGTNGGDHRSYTIGFRVRQNVSSLILFALRWALSSSALPERCSLLLFAS